MFVLLLVGIAFSGCASAKMATTSEPSALINPPADKATVVFTRPSGFAFAIQSSIFDITDGTDNFVGIVSAGKKIAYQTPLGTRRFMVVAETADFTEIGLGGGRVYYVKVEPRMGLTNEGAVLFDPGGTR